jgi:cytoskeleton protein RodZ
MKAMATHDIPRDFGRFLQSQRRAKGISLETIAHQTRITLSNLQYIESEDLEKLPAEVFVKGFLHAYAEALGVDATEVLRRYDARCQAQALWVQGQSQQQGERSFVVRFLLALLLLAILIGGTLYIADYRTQKNQMQAGYSAQESSNGAAKSSQVLTTHENEITHSGTEPTPADVARERVETKAPAESREPMLALELEATEPTWIKVISDGGTPQEFSLQPGDHEILKARDGFNLLVGNAGGIRIVFNGKPIPVIGKSGQVATIQLP